MPLALKIEHLYKKYQRGTIDHRWLLNRLKERCGKQKPDPADPDKYKRGSSFYALNDLSFDVTVGEAVGITGKNGAGKTTLLRVLSGITAPSAGTVKINGRIAGLLDLAAGFHPELTGKENIFLIGAFLGIKKQVLQQKLDTIITFAELQSHIDTPVKRYSSGMFLRLAFSVAVNVDHEILLLDEVFAVGDAGFQEKCVQTINDMVKKKKKSILLVSHDKRLIDSVCSRVIVMEGGTIVSNAH